MKVAVLTVSDRCSRGETQDTSGPGLCRMVEQELEGEVVATEIVPDDPERIADQLVVWATHAPKPDLLLTTGGTGLAPRDHTPEATRRVLEREHAGLIQLMQHRCMAITPLTFLSRGLAGTLADTLIINLPGSRKGSSECFAALLDVIPHAIQTLRGEVPDHGPKAR